jgi:hypothetical protein
MSQTLSRLHINFYLKVDSVNKTFSPFSAWLTGLFASIYTNTLIEKRNFIKVIYCCTSSFNTLAYQKACPEISKAISIMPMESAIHFGYLRYWHYDSLSDSSLWSFGIDVLPLVALVAHVTASNLRWHTTVTSVILWLQLLRGRFFLEIFLTAPASAIG